ncbi:MAG TPA: FAD-binding oxidoreductase, partial [Desulfobacterales bacterium]|nr:FAD-binding oxidoreductase [Desulfobacterales bacterium]
MALDKKIMERLVEVVGEDNCSDADFVVQPYGKSLDSVSGRQAPAAVVIPETTEEVSGIVKIANEFKTPILPRGSGADLTMGAKPTKDGVILLDLNKRMNKIVNIDFDHMVVTAEAGVQWGQLITALLSQGYYTGQLGPANSATTIGGAVSNASVGGGGETMFAGPGRLVASLEVVLPTGEIINTGSAANPKGKPWFGGRFLGGPDLTGMFIGDPGVLGIKTK